jgi:hypothetical protein
MPGRSGAYEAAATLDEPPDELLGAPLAGLAFGSDLDPSDLELSDLELSDLELSDLEPSDLVAEAASAALGSLALWEPLPLSERLSVL